MSQQNVDLVRGTLERFIATGEPSWETMDEQIVCQDHDVPDGAAHVGHEGFVRFLANWSDAWEQWSMEPQEFLDAGDKVVVFVRMAATGASGLSVERDDAIVYTVREGLVTRIDYYNNRPQALASAGLRTED